MVPRPPKFSEAESSTRPATSLTDRTGRLLLAAWLVAATGLVVVGLSWQVTAALDGRIAELGVFMVWLAGLLVGARYLDARYQ